MALVRSFYFAAINRRSWIENCITLVIGRDALAVDSGRYLCLDLLRVTWKAASTTLCDSAILLEVWENGGLLQTSAAIPQGSAVDLDCPHGCFRAIVNSCETDEYGNLLEIAVDPSASWFPSGYNPPYLFRSDEA
jgi:hypothetical protein